MDVMRQARRERIGQALFGCTMFNNKAAYFIFIDNYMVYEVLIQDRGTSLKKYTGYVFCTLPPFGDGDGYPPQYNTQYHVPVIYCTYLELLLTKAIQLCFCFLGLPSYELLCHITAKHISAQMGRELNY